MAQDASGRFRVVARIVSCQNDQIAELKKDSEELKIDYQELKNDYQELKAAQLAQAAKIAEHGVMLAELSDRIHALTGRHLADSLVSRIRTMCSRKCSYFRNARMVDMHHAFERHVSKKKERNGFWTMDADEANVYTDVLNTFFPDERGRSTDQVLELSRRLMITTERCRKAGIDVAHEKRQEPDDIRKQVAQLDATADAENQVSYIVEALIRTKANFVDGRGKELFVLAEV